MDTEWTSRHPSREQPAELFEEATGVSPDDEAAVVQLAKQLKLKTEDRHLDVIRNEIFEEKVEDSLHGPIFVIDYPASICPLTKRKKISQKSLSVSNCLF